MPQNDIAELVTPIPSKQCMLPKPGLGNPNQGWRQNAAAKLTPLDLGRGVGRNETPAIPFGLSLSTALLLTAGQLDEEWLLGDRCLRRRATARLIWFFALGYFLVSEVCPSLRDQGDRVVLPPALGFAP